MTTRHEELIGASQHAHPSCSNNNSAVVLARWAELLLQGSRHRAQMPVQRHHPPL